MTNTIAENLQRLKTAKTTIGNAITAKGGTVGANDGLEEFASDIATIPSGGGGHTVIVTTIPNAEVTLTSLDNTYTGTADETGELELTGVAVGTYDVTATYDNAVSDTTTVTITDYAVTEDSFATLTISASDNTTITVTDGDVTKTLTYTGTPIVQYVSLGPWHLSCTINDTVVTEIAMVDSYTNQDIRLAPGE